MKQYIKYILLLIVVMVGVSCSINMGDASSESTEENQGKEYTAEYICPMHCEGSGSDQPGTCPVCGMAYEENTSTQK